MLWLIQLTRDPVSDAVASNYRYREIRRANISETSPKRGYYAQSTKSTPPLGDTCSFNIPARSKHDAVSLHTIATLGRALGDQRRHPEVDVWSVGLNI